MMKKIKLICVLFLMLQGCAKDNDTTSSRNNFESLYGGKPFKGSAKVVLEREGFDKLTWNGDGLVALVESSSDSISIVFLADLGKNNEINLKLRGKVDGPNFSFNGPNASTFFHIVDKAITGNLSNPAQEMRFEGTMNEQRTRLNAEIYFKQANDPFPQGAKLYLTLDTKRAVVVDGDDNGTGCDMRVVPIWSPTGITMGMVPDC